MVQRSTLMYDTALLGSKSVLSTTFLVMLWILAAVSAVGKYFFEWQGWSILLGLSALIFGISLIWTLGRTKPMLNELSASDLFAAKRLGFWVRTLLLLLGLAITFFLGMFTGLGLILMMVCGLLGLALTLAWRKKLTWKVAGVGLAMGLISVLGVVLLGMADLLWAAAYLITIPPAFTGGALLLQRTRLGHVRILDGKPALLFRGLLIGCLLGVPASLFNLLGNMQGKDTYIIHWWQPFYAIVPAIAEESWARLFIVSFCYAVLRPASDVHPRRAAVVAILISILAFSSAHAGLNTFVILIDGVIFSTPYALLLIKKDFEHAVGYHFITDFFRFITAFLS
jgi:hypothetical protein